MQGTVITKSDNKLMIDDNMSEISYEIQSTNDLPLHLLISDADLQKGNKYMS